MERNVDGATGAGTRTRPGFFRRVLCWIGWHDHELVPPCSSDEMGKQMVESKDGFELLGRMLAGIFACKWVCKHCGHETRT